MALVTRNSMIGVEKIKTSSLGGCSMNGVHDMGGMHGMGPCPGRRSTSPCFTNGGKLAFMS